MLRRLAPSCLLLAWLCASGAVLDVAQVFAWSRMFVGYARTECVLAAAKDTFDPGRPCEFCRAVSKAREASSGHGQAAPELGSRKLVLVYERVDAFLCPAPSAGWPEPAEAIPLSRKGEVLVPPPRLA